LGPFERDTVELKRKTVQAASRCDIWCDSHARRLQPLHKLACTWSAFGCLVDQLLQSQARRRFAGLDAHFNLALFHARPLI